MFWTLTDGHEESKKTLLHRALALPADNYVINGETERWVTQELPIAPFYIELSIPPAILTRRLAYRVMCAEMGFFPIGLSYSCSRTSID